MKRKAVIGMLSMVLLCAGCSDKKNPSSASSVPDEEPVNYGVWLVQPQKDYSEVYELTPQGKGFLQVQTNTFGTVNVAYEMEMDEYPASMNGYEVSAVIVEKDSKQGIVSYTGKELYPMELDVMNSSRMAGITYGWQLVDGKYVPVYAITSQPKGKAMVFSKDFKTVTEVSMNEFASVVPQGDYALPYFALQNGQFGIVGMTKSDSGSTTGWVFEALNPSILSTSVIIDTVDEWCNTLHKVIYDPKSGSTTELSSIGKYSEGSWINGLYRVNDNGLVSVIDDASGQAIAYQYQNAGVPQEGYIPAKKYGKWGYLDTNGNEVTDFVFDEAKAVCKGYAWVRYDGAWGVLKFEKSLSGEAQINISTVSEPCQDEKLGEVKVKITGLTIREGASSDSGFIGNAAFGSVYPYYETNENGGYTWYRVSNDAWVADNGEWLEVIHA